MIYLEEKYVNLLLLPELLRHYDKARRILRHAEEKRYNLLDRYGNFNKSSKLAKANTRYEALKEQCNECKQSITNLIIDDEYWTWNTTEITVNGNVLNIYYGKGYAFCRGHGHYIINLSKNRIVYHRSLNTAHGSQNYLHLQNNTSN